MFRIRLRREALRSRGAPTECTYRVLRVSSKRAVGDSSKCPASAGGGTYPKARLPTLRQSLSSVAFLGSSAIVLPHPASAGMPAATLAVFHGGQSTLVMGARSIPLAYIRSTYVVQRLFIFASMYGLLGLMGSMWSGGAQTTSFVFSGSGRLGDLRT